MGPTSLARHPIGVCESVQGIPRNCANVTVHRTRSERVHIGVHVDKPTWGHADPTCTPRVSLAAAPGRRWICQPDGVRKKTVVAHRRAKEQRRWRHRRRSAKSALPSVRASDTGSLPANRTVNADKCKPAKCRQECKRSCPVVRMGTCAEVGAFAVWLTCPRAPVY